jgi:hypothetical protein
MIRVAIAIALCGACGRFGFEERLAPVDSAADGTGDAASGHGFVQATCVMAAATTATQTTAYPNNVHAQDLLVVASDFIGTTQTGSVTDTMGNTFTQLPIGRSSAQSAMIFYAIAAADGPDTVTLTLSATSTSVNLQLHEYRGVSGLVTSSINKGTSTMPATHAVNAAPDDVVFAYAAIVTATITGVAQPFMSRETCHRNMTADAVATTSSMYAATFTADMSFAWIAHIAQFR